MRSDLSNVRVPRRAGGSFEDLGASGANVPIFNQTVSALRFFFYAAPRRLEIVEYTHCIHEPRKLPVVLRVEEVARARAGVP